ncbi:MAG: hypothetical protein HW405_708 [Candidatus Berkelbacteria bacterium]|nr:hypothetical protein [Candidatus Berkelbacteria bacterium]
MRGKKITITLLVILLFIIGFIGGVVYWTFVRTKNIANSALDAAKNAQSVTAPSPTSVKSTPVPTLTMPEKDVEGEDLSDVPRFSSSIRSDYSKSDDGQVTNIEYFTSTSIQEILQFYKDTLLKTDWLLRAEDTGALTFSKVDANATIEIINQDKSAKITQYQIHFFVVKQEEN